MLFGRETAVSKACTAGPIGGAKDGVVIFPRVPNDPSSGVTTVLLAVDNYAELISIIGRLTVV